MPAYASSFNKMNPPIISTCMKLVALVILSLLTEFFCLCCINRIPLNLLHSQRHIPFLGNNEGFCVHAFSVWFFFLSCPFLIF
uniref:Uncharacterized protein n=1 Tax=Anguilla anguilla TaxID=7936 RepID=A0A0E9X4G2_ANGAN